MLDETKVIKSLFQIYPDVIFPGYTWGKVWNGWATPYFTTLVARAVMEKYYKTWTVIDDALTGSMEDGELDIWDPVDLNGVMLYAIGAWSWTWDRVTCQDCHKNEKTTYLLDKGKIFIVEKDKFPYHLAFCNKHGNNEDPECMLRLPAYLKHTFGEVHADFD